MQGHQNLRNKATPKRVVLAATRREWAGGLKIERRAGDRPSLFSWKKACEPSEELGRGNEEVSRLSPDETIMTSCKGFGLLR